MECGIFPCPRLWAELLPPGVRRVEQASALTGRRWDLLALKRPVAGMARLRCRILLTPGDCAAAVLAQVQAEAVVTCGLSHRDSLTLSSLREPVLCVQRVLPRPDGGEIEPQEFLLPPLPAPPEELLLLLGLRLLQMPLAQPPFVW